MKLTQEDIDACMSLTVEEVESALKDIKDSGTVFGKPKVSKVLRKLEGLSSSLGGPKQKLHKYAQQMTNGLGPLLGPANVWMTLNPLEHHSQIVFQIAGKENGEVKLDLPDNFMSCRERLKFCADNPVAVALFYDTFVRAVLEHLLGMPFGQANPFETTHRGVFGYTKAYYMLTETSGRYGPHLHGLLWLEGHDIGNMQRLAKDADFLKDFEHYLWQTYCTHRGACEVEPWNKLYKPQMVPARKLDIKNPEAARKQYETRIAHVVGVEQCHDAHNSRCKQYGHAGTDNDCGLFYPRRVVIGLSVEFGCRRCPITNEQLVEVVNMIQPRDDSRVVSWNPVLAFTTGINQCSEYLGPGKAGRDKASYMAKYMTKRALQQFELLSLLLINLKREDSDPKRSRREQSRKDVDGNDVGLNTKARLKIRDSVMDYLGTREECAYEAARTVLGLPEIYSSVRFFPLPAWALARRYLGEKEAQWHRATWTVDPEEETKQTSFYSLLDDFALLDLRNQVDKDGYLKERPGLSFYEFIAFYEKVSATSSREKRTGTKMLKKRRRVEKRRLGIEIPSIDQDSACSESDTELHDEEDNALHERIDLLPEHVQHGQYHFRKRRHMRVPYFVGGSFPRSPKEMHDVKSPMKEHQRYAAFVLAAFYPKVLDMRALDTTPWDFFIEWRRSGTIPQWIINVLRNMDACGSTKRKRKGVNRKDLQKVSRRQAVCVNETIAEAESAGISRESLFEQLCNMFLVNGEAVQNRNRANADNALRCVMKTMNSKRFSGVIPNAPYVASAEFVIRNHIPKVTSQRRKDWGEILKEYRHLAQEHSISGVGDVNFPQGVRRGSDKEYDTLYATLMPWFTERKKLDQDQQQDVEKDFKATQYSPSWLKRDVSPTIEEAITLWHLNDKQALAVYDLLSFHRNHKEGDQYLGQVVGGPGTGKSQTLLCILWYFSQCGEIDKVKSGAYSGGAAVQLRTPELIAMTTARLFALGWSGKTSEKKLQGLLVRFREVEYVFIDEFSFLSYEHLYEIHNQLCRSERFRSFDPSKPFAGMNLVFFGDYHQLPKPGGFPMFHGATFEEDYVECIIEQVLEDPERMQKYLGGRLLWHEVTHVTFLEKSTRFEDSPGGRKLVERIAQLMWNEELPESFFDDLNSKAVKHLDLKAPEWGHARFIVLTNKLRAMLNFAEAQYRCALEKKLLFTWNTRDELTVDRLPMPAFMEPILDTMVIKKLTRKQFYYRECEVAFNDNRYFDTGHATNNTGKLIGIIPSELEDVDGLRISNGVVHLEHLPCALLVQVENVPWFQLAPDLPPRTIVISPQKVSTSMVLPKKIFVPSEAKTLNELKIYREGFNVSYCHAVTDYYAQGKTISEPVILDLHLPENLMFRRHLFFHWVTMLSRSETDEKIALLEPLWSGGNTQNPERTRVIREFRKYLKYPPDLAAELSRVMRLEKVNAQKVIDKLKAEENWDGDLKQRLLETLLSVQKNGSVPIITSGSRRTSRTTKPIKCMKRSLPTRSSSVYKPLCRKRVKTSPDSVNLICRASPGMKTNIASATVPAEFQLIGGKTISKTSMQGLLDGAWVVDDIIYIFIKLLLYKVLKKPLDSDVYEPTQGICVLDPTFDSMFFQRGHCTEHRYKVPTEAEAKEALEYMKQPVIRRALETQLCLIPINFYGYHWSLIVIDKMQQKLYYIDSKDLAQTEELLNVYLCAYKETTGHCLQIERVQNAIIRQHNNRDCGALVCKFIEAIITAENRSSVVDAVNQINGKLGKQYRLQIHNFISGFVI